MKRIQEKVKDLVEVRAYKNLHDFVSDPVQTLANYHFTDITADMMSKWLDTVSEVSEQNGAAKALAGYRGVGKSHFLATLGAIVANPELRSRITQSLVAAGAQRLKRRRYPVAYVRRGTFPTLLEELKAGISVALEIEKESLSDSLSELLDFAAQQADESSFVLIIDTAFEREARVSRDDGEMLGEIAVIAKNLNLFVAVALDDDIAGADGVNAAITASYTIDYLDQEHLYNIVDAHVFPKHRQTQHLLYEIYTYFRQVLPHFRWSEQRFSALYPLHPVILENAPFVRLYAPEFALLGFASEAGAKILGRPAYSLVALDEVFDSTENTLRKVEDLKETFEIYDRVNAQVVSQIPVMQRLQAKLILKALLLLSLNGEGTTAGDIAAAILIYDETDPPKAITEVESLLDTFAASISEGITRKVEDGRENHYLLKVGNKDNLNHALHEKIETVSPDVIPAILRRMARERFSDWTLSSDGESSDWMDCQINWRGGLRRGRITWNWENKTGESAQMPINAEVLDWELKIVNSLTNGDGADSESEIPKVFWKTATLRKDEEEAIMRFHLLLTDESLRGEYGDQIRAAGHAHTLAVEKIWTRIFITEGRLSIDGIEVEFSDEAKSALTLSQMFSGMLEPLFEARFPEHPYFSQPLGMTEVTSLVNDLFSGARSNLAEVQELAEKFAFPLGLVKNHNDALILESEEKLIQLPLAKGILNLVKQSGDTVSLKTIYRHLKQPPFGLVREAQHLVLTALVAQRQIEFVTSKGDRINRRSLDLKIIWDDIEGIAKPSSRVYSNKRLTEWANTLTGADQFKAIDTPEEHQSIQTALETWLKDWRSARMLERFDELPDEILNTRMWRISINAAKTFGTVAETVKAVADGFIQLDEALHRIADAFSDSEEDFIERAQDLVVLEDFINGAQQREKIWSYLAVSEPTQDETIENYREKLLQMLDETYHNPSDALNKQMENLWQMFHDRFAEHFAVKHDTVMKSHHLQEQFDAILRSDDWWEFENLSHFPVFHQRFWDEAGKNCRQFRELDCRFDVRAILKTHPFCACSFNLTQIGEWEKLPANLRETIQRGRESYRRTLSTVSSSLIPIFDRLAQSNNEFSEPAQTLGKILKEGKELPRFSNDQLFVLQKAIKAIPQNLGQIESN
ncbi:hypothetical protein BH20ACI4_BH20ACI4_20260 [soil metagenome]